jgi:hypothetical protein
MGIYFKVYHKLSKDPIATFNERQIVDFCMSNKETIKKYYFSTGGQKDLMEWEVFAVKHADLFVQKAKEREEQEKKVSESVEIKESSKLPFLIVGFVAAVLIAAVIAAFIYRVVTKDDANRRVHDLSSTQAEGTEPAADAAKPQNAPKPAATGPMKRDPQPGDDKFLAKAPAENILQAAWDKSKKPIPASLGPMELKEEMDKYLPGLQTCFNDRAKAGDRGLRGTVNMKIRVAGDGTVLEVLFPDDKYKATLFTDCLGAAIKGQKFRMFKSKEQVFSYYYEL